MQDTSARAPPGRAAPPNGRRVNRRSPFPERGRGPISWATITGGRVCGNMESRASFLVR